jgi:chromosome segregation ATPase
MLERKDVLTDDLMMAPKILTKDFEGLYKTLLDISKVSRDIRVPGAGGGTQPGTTSSGTGEQAISSTKKLKEETAALTAQQKEPRDNEEYRKQTKELSALKQQLKEKQILGERDATTVNKQNASLTELRAALNANRVSYAQLVTEEQRATKEGIALLATIQDQDAAVKELAGSTGQHQDNVGDYAGQMKKLRDELKLAKDEMVGIAKNLGTDSQEFQEAAAKAGELKNEIGDLEQTVKAVAGSKFENLSSSLSLVGTKLKGLDFKGANVAAKQFLTTMKSITFKEAY